MSALTLLILAAGIGSRYGGLKQIEPVGPHGEWILDYSVYDALQVGFDRVVLVIRPEIEPAFRQRVGSNLRARCPVTYVLQSLDDLPAGYAPPLDRSKPWGTAHAVYCCRHVIDSPFVVLNADDFYGRSAYRTLADYLRAAEARVALYDYCMVGYSLEDTLTAHGRVARGLCSVDPGGFLTAIQERRAVEPFGGGARFSEDGVTWTVVPVGTPVSMNIWGFTPSLFAELGNRLARFLANHTEDILRAEFLLPEVVGQLVCEKRATVRVLPASERWFGVTYRRDRPLVKKAIRDLIDAGVYPERLWQNPT